MRSRARWSPSTIDARRARRAPARREKFCVRFFAYVDPDDFGKCDEYFCGNDPYWRYDAGDKGLLGCDDIAGEPEKIENRCRTQERIGVDATGREVRASWACKGVCRFECEGC